jgi:8-oxo-dGTP diphosphatase
LNKIPPVTCAACGREHWFNAKPGAAALVERDGELLLVRRAHDPWRGYWCAPAGFCDGGEHPADAAEREAFEETGVRVRVKALFGIWVSEYGDASQAEHDLISVAYYLAEPLDADLTPFDSAEVDEVRWFTPSDLPTLVAPPGTFERVLAAWCAVRVENRAVELPERGF